MPSSVCTMWIQVRADHGVVAELVDEGGVRALTTADGPFGLPSGGGAVLLGLHGQGQVDELHRVEKRYSVTCP